MVKSLQAALIERLERDPHGRAVAFYDESERPAWKSYEEFVTSANRLASTFRAHGLATGDVCLLVLESAAFAAHATLAVLLMGATPLLVAPPWAKAANSTIVSTIVSAVEKTGAAFVVSEPWLSGLRDRVGQLSQGTHWVHADDSLLVDGDRRTPEIELHPSRVAGLQLTSGTTGTPRICVWNHERMLAAFDYMADAMHVGPADVLLNWTPLYHDMGLVNNYLLCLVKGIPLVLMNNRLFARRPVRWLRALSDVGATTSWAPNFAFALAAARASDRDLQGVSLGHVRGLWNAAERIHHETMHAFYERFARYGLRFDALKTNYGLAENIGGATFSDPDGEFLVEHVDAAALYEEGIAIPLEAGSPAATPCVGVGRPHAGIEVSILDEDGRALEDGRVGRIALRTASRMECYAQEPIATRKALHGELLLTGDRGYSRDAELFWTGREAERITVRGRKFDASDLERVLLKVAGLRKSCFVGFGVDDVRIGTQRLVVLSEVEPASQSPAELERMRTETARRLFVALGIPDAQVLLLPSGTLMKTSSGKRRHSHYRGLYLNDQLEPSVL